MPVAVSKGYLPYAKGIYHIVPLEMWYCRLYKGTLHCNSFPIGVPSWIDRALSGSTRFFSFSPYIGIGAKSRNRPKIDKTRLCIAKYTIYIL